MKTATRAELLEKIEALTTGLTQQMHALSFDIVNGFPVFNFLCRADESAECHFYADCYCEYPMHSKAHRVVEHRRCYLEDVFTEIPEITNYSGADAIRLMFNDNWIRSPSISRTGFIKTQIQNELVLWSWLELSDLELLTASA